jgi:hypothetical protein
MTRKKLTPGNVYPEDQLKLGDPSRDLATDSVQLRGDCLLIADDLKESEGHFCIQQKLDVADKSRDVQVDAHFDWHLPAGADIYRFSGAKFRVFRRNDRQLTFLGDGHVCQVGGDGEHMRMQVSLRQLDGELADKLTRCQDSVIDGTDLQAALKRRNCDRMQLAKKLAESWLGKLPPAKDPISSRRKRPDEVKAWHRLWSQLEPFHPFPWCCWPACWDKPDEQGVSYFQNEWQNGGTFGYRRDGIWIHRWACNSGMARAASDIAEFALQFVIYGLVQGADGRFVITKRCPKWVEPLPMTSWENFLYAEYVFVGGDGAIGIRTNRGTTLAVTKDRFEKLL